MRFPHRQTWLLLGAVILPSVLVIAPGVHVIRQEDELAEKRFEEQRQQAIGLARQHLSKRAGRTHPARPPVPGSVEERQGGCAPLSGQDQRPQLVANHPLDRPLARARRHRAARFETPPLPTPLHVRRYRSLGRRRRGARRPLGPGRASYSATRIRGLRQGRLSAAGLDLGLPYLQPTACAYREHHVH